MTTDNNQVRTSKALYDVRAREVPAINSASNAALNFRAGAKTRSKHNCVAHKAAPRTV